MTHPESMIVAWFVGGLWAVTWAVEAWVGG